MVLEKKAHYAKERFVRKYYDPEYVNGVGISRVGMCDANAPENKKNDYCIRVNLRKSLPDDLVFPSTYCGVRVYVRVIGEIRPLKS